MKSISTTALVNVFLALVLAQSARADDAGTFDLSQDAAIKAYSQLKARLAKHSPEEYAKISAAVAGGAGLAYGVGKYAAYKTALAESARSAALLKKEISRVTLTVTRAIEPELQRFGTALLKREAAMTAQEAETAITNGLKSPEVKKRIMDRLLPELGGEAAGVFEKIIGSRSASILAKNFLAMRQLATSGAAEIAARTIGVGMAKEVALSVAPSTARLTVKTLLARTGPLARCLGKFGIVGRGALRILGSGAATVAMILLDSSTADAATLSGYYAKNPEELVALDPEKALTWIQHYPEVRGNLIKTRDLVSQMESDEGQNSGLTGDSLLACGAEGGQENLFEVQSSAQIKDAPPAAPAANGDGADKLVCEAK